MEQIEVPQQSTTPTEPLSPQVRAPEPQQEPAKPVSARDAVEAAFKKSSEAQAAKTEAKEAPKAESKPEVKEPPKQDRERSETGQFKSKVADAPQSATGEQGAPKAESAQSEGQAKRYEAPARFNSQAKTEWEGVSENVKSEVTRMQKELEDGHAKYKESADRYETLREYDELARKNGRDGLSESLKQIRDIEDTMARNPIEGLKKVADHFNLNLQAVASHILGQNPNQQVQDAHRQIQELKSQIQAMKDEANAPKLVEDFFSKNEEASSYTDAISTALRLGIVSNLEDAWEYAKIFGKPDKSGPSASNATGSQEITSPEPASAQNVAAALPNPAGQKSVSGAPSSNQEVIRKSDPSKSPLDAVRKAAARLG